MVAALVAEHGYDTILFSNSVLAADVAAGLAARLEAGINWDLVDLAVDGGELVGKQPTLQRHHARRGRLALPAAHRPLPRRFVRGRAHRRERHRAAGERGAAPRTRSAPSSPPARCVPRKAPRIEDAEVIVAGGIGLGSEEGFGLAEELAGVLGGAVGATRAAVYKGWYPYSAQIGQTGKTVSPSLYLALGISGAVQHKVGMQNSKTIVSINKDANAPIFEFSDLSVVGDVQVIVPELIARLREHAGS